MKVYLTTNKKREDYRKLFRSELALGIPDKFKPGEMVFKILKNRYFDPTNKVYVFKWGNDAVRRYDEAMKIIGP